MTPITAQKTVLDLFRAVTDVVGAQGWDMDGTNGWGDCTEPGAKEHAQFGYFGNRHASLPAPPREIAESVQKAWEALGVHIDTIVTDTSIEPPNQLILSSPAYLHGSNPDGSNYYFAVADAYVIFNSNSACVPGDFSTLNGQYDATTPPSG